MEPSLEERIAETLVARRAAQFAFVRELVGTPSMVPPGDARAAADLVGRRLRELGFGVEAHAVPDADAEARGLRHVTNLVARIVFGAGPVVALAAHGDTPEAGDGWSGDPLAATIREGVLSGLGVLAKADIAAYAHALAALRDSGCELAGTVELHVTFDGSAEGELGPKWLLDNGIVNPDYAIAGGFAHGVGTSAMGDLQMAVTLTRLSAKAAGAAGVPPGDPVEAATRVTGALYDLRAAFAGIRSATPGIGPPELTIGAIGGGERADRTADKVSVRLDRRIIPEEDPAAVEADLTNLIAVAASHVPGVVCRIQRLGLAPPMRPGPGSKRLADAIAARARAAFGEDVGAYGVPYDANSRHYAAVGVPTVLYGAGPKPADGRPGGPDERLVLDDLRKATGVVALALADFLKPAA